MPRKSVKVKKDFWFYAGEVLSLAFIGFLAATAGVALAYAIKSLLIIL